MKSNGQQVGSNGTGMALPVTSKDERDAVISSQAVKIAHLEKAIELRNLRLQESHERADLYKARNEDLESKAPIVSRSSGPHCSGRRPRSRRGSGGSSGFGRGSRDSSAGSPANGTERSNRRARNPLHPRSPTMNGDRIMRDRNRFKRELGLTGWPPVSEAIFPLFLGAGAALPFLGACLPAWPASPEAAAGTLVSGAAIAGVGLGGLLARSNRPVTRTVMPDHPDGLVVGVSESGREVVWPTAEQVWHGILVGKPGSGKTVQLMSLAYQKIRRGGSVVFIDAKPSERNLRQFLWMAKTTGRLDDLRALLPGMPSRSHSINPLSEGDEEAQTSLLTSLRRFKGTSATEHYQDIHDDVVAAVIGVLKERRDLTGEHYHWGDVLAALSSDAARAELMSGRLTDAKSPPGLDAPGAT